MIRPIIRFNLKKTLIFLYVALGPLGNLLTPVFFPKSFRIYYLLLPLFPIFFLMTKERIAKIGILLLPVLTYSYFSTVCVENFGSANESHTLFRYYLFVCQFFFVIGAASALETRKELFAIIKTYFISFFVTLFVGYIFFIGFWNSRLLHAYPIGQN